MKLNLFSPIITICLLQAASQYLFHPAWAGTVHKGPSMSQPKSHRPTSLSPAPFYDIPLELIDGKHSTLSPYRGKAILIVNTASQCGFTPQYKGLQELDHRFGSQGLVIIGAPCNQFGGQEPGSASEIKHFCERRYGVKFPLLKKLEVNGQNRHPLYQHLLAHSSDQSDIEWNFEKFLISKSGQVLKRFKSAVDPLSTDMVQSIESALKE